MGSQECPPYRVTFATFAERTTAHGIGRIAGSRSKRRALWTFLVLLSTGVVVYQIYTLIKKFTLFEVATELRVSYNRHMQFPAVTLCNLNALRLSKVIDPRVLPRDMLTSLPDVRREVVQTFVTRSWLLNLTGIAEANVTGDSFMQKLLEDILEAEVSGMQDPLNITYSNGVVQILDALNIPIDKVNEENKNFGYPLPRQVEPGVLRQALYAVLLAYVDEEVVSRVGHQAQDFILTCAFDGLRCNYTDFYEFQSDTFGNCFTFNHGHDGAPIRRMGHSGPKHALRLEINVEQYEYVTFLQETAGVRLLVHDQGIRPFPQEEGITVAPGYHTSIGINRNGITRLPRPHGNCTHGSPSIQLPGYKYSVMACLKLCLQRAVISGCACRVPLLPSGDTDVPVCSFADNKDDYICMLKVAATNPSLKDDCSCPESCRDLSFNPMLSFGDWPNAATQKKTLTEIVDVTPLLRLIPDSNALVQVRANLLRMDLYFQELNDIQIVQRESYGWLSLVSDVGGQMGLWIGMSVLSLCEGIELLADVMNLLIKRSERQQTQKVEVSPR